MNRAFAENSGRLVEIQGAAATVQDLAAMNLRQIAVSNSNRAVVDVNLNAIGVAEVMEFSLSLDDVCEGKPDPFPYRFACYRLGLDPSEVLAVEDSATGVASARAAGLPVAFLGAAEGTPGGSEFAISALSELPDVIAGLSGLPENTRECRERPAPRRLRQA